MSTRVPFTVLDEAMYHIERKHSPLNIQLGVGAGGRIDIDRLREAVVEACEAHPLARAKQREAEGWERGYDWEVSAAPPDPPVREVSVEDTEEFAEVQTEFYSEPFDLTEEPPFRLLVARDAEESGCDRLLTSVSHVPADGVGTLRLVRTVSQAYNGDEIETDVNLEESRDVPDDARPSSVTKRLERLGNAASHLTNTVDAPESIAKDGASGRDGWGFVERRLGELGDRVVRNRPNGASVNDVLLAALHLTIDDWNREHGESTEKISLMMPINLRPRDWFYDVFGMYAIFGSVSTKSAHRGDALSTVRRVSSQTEELKERDRAAAYVESLNLIPPTTPVGLRGQLPEFLKGPGERLLDTAVLSNLGRVPEPLPALEGDKPESVWFSPPCIDGMPVGIGVATAGGEMHLSFRHTFDQFDGDAARRFADTYVENLAETVKSPATP